MPERTPSCFRNNAASSRKEDWTRVQSLVPRANSREKPKIPARIQRSIRILCREMRFFLNSVRRLLGLSLLILLFHAPAPASERETSPDESLLLVQKTIAEEQWAITYRLRDGYVTGNVFREGEAPVFLACRLEERADGQTRHDCFSTDAAGEWIFLATIDLPESFWAGEGQRIPAGSSDFCGAGTEINGGVCAATPTPPATCEAPLDECLELLEACRADVPEIPECRGADFCDAATTLWSGTTCVAPACPISSGSEFCDPATSVWNGSACVAATLPPAGPTFCGSGTVWSENTCLPEREHPVCEDGFLYDTRQETCVPAPCVWPALGQDVNPDGIFFAGGSLPGIWNALHQAGAGLSATHLDLAKPTLQIVKDLCLEVVRLRDSSDCSDGYFWHREICVCEHKRHC